MIVTERHTMKDIDWADYVNIPAHSFSSLRNTAPIVPTAKMQLGTRIDNYLFEPHKYDGQDLALVKSCASVLKSVIGNIRYDSQLTAIANFQHDGFIMPTRGRLDMRVPGLVIDMKISTLDPYKAISHFRYDWQITGYCLLTGDVNGMIISINPKTLKPSIINIPLKTDWWELQTIAHGKRIIDNRYENL